MFHFRHILTLSLVVFFVAGTVTSSQHLIDAVVHDHAQECHVCYHVKVSHQQQDITGDVVFLLPPVFQENIVCQRELIQIPLETLSFHSRAPPA